MKFAFFTFLYLVVQTGDVSKVPVTVTLMVTVLQSDCHVLTESTDRAVLHGMCLEGPLVYKLLLCTWDKYLEVCYVSLLIYF